MLICYNSSTYKKYFIYKVLQAQQDVKEEKKYAIQTRHNAFRSYL